MNAATPSSQFSDRIVREITINAPAQRVFAALADPNQRIQWWHSKGRFQLNHMDSDLRPGGKYEMRGAGFGDRPFTVRGQYVAVDPPRLLEFTWLADWDPNASTTVRFDLEENGGVTTVRLTHWGFTDDRSKENYQGWQLLLTMLQKHLQSPA